MGFQVERCTFTLCFGPASREPAYVLASRIIVGNDVFCVVREFDRCGVGRMGCDDEIGAGSKIVELMQSECLAVIGRVSFAVEW